MGARRVKRYRVVIPEHRTEVCRSCWLWYVKRVLHTEGRYGWVFCPLDGFIWDWYGLIKGAGGSACTLTNWICQVPRCDVDFSSKLPISYSTKACPQHFEERTSRSEGFAPSDSDQCALHNLVACHDEEGWGSEFGTQLWRVCPFVGPMKINENICFFTKLWVFFWISTIWLIENPNYYFRTPVLKNCQTFHRLDPFLHADPFSLIAACLHGRDFALVDRGICFSFRSFLPFSLYPSRLYRASGFAFYNIIYKYVCVCHCVCNYIYIYARVLLA